MFGKCAAVYVDPRLVGAEGMEVQSARDQFLASAGFANNENRGIVVRHAFDHLQQSSHRLTAEDGLYARQVQNYGFTAQTKWPFEALGRSVGQQRRRPQPK